MSEEGILLCDGCVRAGDRQYDPYRVESGVCHCGKRAYRRVFRESKRTVGDRYTITTKEMHHDDE